MSVPATTDADRGETLLRSASVRSAVIAVFTTRGRTAEITGARLLRPSRGRPVVAYDVRWWAKSGRSSTEVVVGKAYRRGGGPSTHALMVQLWQTGRVNAPGWSMPRPLGYVDEPPVLLQTCVPAPVLYDHIDTPAAAEEAVTATGRWLATLHTLPVPAGAPAWTNADEQRKLDVYISGLAETRPDLSDRLRGIARQTVSQLAGLDGPPVATHGDFQPKNVHLDGSVVTVIDFDRCALSHPARDLGHFVGQSMTMSYVRTGSFDAVRPWVSGFLDGYREQVPAGAEAGLQAYVVRTFLEVLYYRLCVRPMPDTSFAPAWVAACEGQLNDSRDPAEPWSPGSAG